jgi:hypothetical protein
VERSTTRHLAACLTLREYVQPVQNTFSLPTTCELPEWHDDPLHRAGEVKWETYEYALGRSASEGVFRGELVDV